MGLQHLSREEVEARIAEGDLLVIRHGYALRLNNWIVRHPGGDKAILHMVGRDGSDEIDVYHSEDTLRKMNVFRVGTVDMPWKGFVPPIQGGKFRTREEIAAGKQCANFVPPTPVVCPTLNSQEAEVMDEFIDAELKFDLDKYPKVTPEVQTHIQTKFRDLYDTLEKQGWFETNYWGYVREATRITSLLALGFYLFGYRNNSMWYLFFSAISIGLAWHQLTFIAHDAGHLSITHDYYIDNLAGILVASFVGGLSLGWWKRNHNVHHIVTNDPVHDPDIQHLPFFAVSSRLFGSIYSTFYEKVLTYDAAARVLLLAQHWLYYPILCFGRFNLYRLSWEYLLVGLGPRRGKAAVFRYIEIVGMAFFFWWYFYIMCYKMLDTAAQRWLFILVSHIVTMPVHVQITLSHFAQSTSDMGVDESFAQRQVRTTMDVACPAWFDYVHGGLQFQTVHHLFPRMPRHNFRAVQPQVIEFCNDLGLHYCIYGFTVGNMKVIDHLHEVAQQAAVFRACNEFCRKELVGGKTPHLDKAVQEVHEQKSRNI